MPSPMDRRRDRVIAALREDGVALGLLLLVTAAAAAVGTVYTVDAVENWYPTLDKPAWTPPDWLFGPVWTTLYALMAIAAWLVWRRRHEGDVRGAMALYGAQLVLNSAWSLIFFGLQRPGYAALEIVALWAMVLVTLVAFARRDRRAGWLMAPYLAWVTYAAALNVAIWWLNP